MSVSSLTGNFCCCYSYYSLEAAKLLLGTLTLSPQQSAQLQWSRFVNTHGREGCNIPMDLHLEHLNRLFKTVLAGLHSNITPIEP